MRYDLIITIVTRGFADSVMDAAKAAGAFGGTVLYGRGTGIHEAEKFFGIIVQPEKELVLILAENGKKNDIMTAICKGAGLHKEGKGICFSLPVETVMGISRFDKMEQLEKLAKEKKQEPEEAPPQKGEDTQQ